MTNYKAVPMAKDLLKLREKIERSKDKNNYTEAEMSLMTSAYKEITGTFPPVCANCDILFTILRNWFKSYDVRVVEPVKKVLKPIKKAPKKKAKVEPKPEPKPTVKADASMKVAQLRIIAKEQGLKIPTKATKADLIKLING
jgi:hypothetical protein